MAVVSLSYLLEAGVHFGHQTRRWNTFTQLEMTFILSIYKKL